MSGLVSLLMVHQETIEELKYLSYRSENKSRNKGNQQEVSYSKNHTNDHHDTLLFNVLFPPSIILLAYFRFKENAIKI